MTKNAVRFIEGSILLVILYSIVLHVVEVEFVDEVDVHPFFVWSERVIGALFTVEYLTRWVASRRLFYPFGPMAIVDLLSILPFYLGFMVDLRFLRVIRALRIVRLFKLYRYTSAMEHIGNAFFRVRYEFSIIGFAVLTLGWLGAVAVHELEREAQPQAFGKLSDSAWFVLTTITTVGYGDKVPATPGGRFATSMVMLGGLGLFGTFVSLIGSAFVEELRRSRNGDADEVAALLPDMTAENFDAAIVLQTIKAATEEGENNMTREEATRLLSAACQRLTST